MTPSTPECPSHFLLDQWTLGELEPAARADVEHHVGSCARCQRRLTDRRADEADFVVDLATLRALQEPALVLEGASPSSAAAATTMSAASSSRAPRWWQRARGPAVGALVAAGLAVAVVRASDATGPDADAIAGATNASWSSSASPGVRAKGGARSALYVQDATGVRPVSTDGGSSAGGDGASVTPTRVHPGDTLQVAVTSATDVFVAVVSQDGAGQASTYVAAADGGLVRVAAGRNVPLPRATILDDVLGTETVAVFLCAAPGPRAADLTTFAVSGAPPPGCVVERHALDKQGSR
jgi:hypothetical protein